MDRTAGIIVIVVTILAMYLYSQGKLDLKSTTSETILPPIKDLPGQQSPMVPAKVDGALDPLVWGSLEAAGGAVQGGGNAGTTVNVYQGNPPAPSYPYGAGPAPSLPLPFTSTYPGPGYPGYPAPTPQQAAAGATGGAIGSALSCKGVLNCVVKGGVAAALTALTFGLL